MAVSTVLILDNFDSFTYNVRHALAPLCERVDVVRADEPVLEQLQRLNPDLVVISPGPGTPESACAARALLTHLRGGKRPVFGICLGMQVIALEFGGEVGRLPEPVHGKTTSIDHDGHGMFIGLPQPLEVARYHSLAVTTVPPNCDVVARAPGGEVMALRHRHEPIGGVQFHPESFLTSAGRQLLENVIRGDL